MWRHEWIGYRPQKGTARRRTFAFFVFLLVGGVGVWAAVLALGTNRRLQDAAPGQNADGDPFAEAVGSPALLRELAGRLGHCRTAAASPDETARLGDDTIRLPPANTTTRAQREQQSSVVGCTGVVYAWSPAMPLSERGITEVTDAARDLGLTLHVVDASGLYVLTDSLRADSGFDDPLSGESTARSTRAHDVHAEADRALAAELIAAGVTVHYPAILIYREGRLLGEAIVGYKTAAAYRAMIVERLALRTAEGRSSTRGRSPRDPAAADGQPDTLPGVIPTVAPNPKTALTDIPVDGQPGPYFRFVHGRGAIAFESGRVIYLLDLATGTTRVAPGFVDFVPSPDGRFFVTPADQGGGLEFYDADEVFAEAEKGAGADVQPFYVDHAMRDQYPSVGVLDTTREANATWIAYRVLTSWFDKVMFRDYDVRLPAGSGGRRIVRPATEPLVACLNREVSLPIIAQDGRELAARDEASATTKIFRLANDGMCTELMDTRLQTGKVAWAADGRRIAFAIPRGLVHDGAGVLWRGADYGGELAGIFVLDRDELRLTRVRGSEQVRRHGAAERRSREPARRARQKVLVGRFDQPRRAAGRLLAVRRHLPPGLVGSAPAAAHRASRHRRPAHG